MNPKKKADVAQDLEEKQRLAANGAVKQAYGKITTAKVKLCSEKAQMMNYTPKDAREARLVDALKIDIEECIDGTQEHEKKLLEATSNKTSSTFVMENVTYLHEVAEFLADIKKVEDRARKVVTKIS